jgi:hypothetical protein
MIADICNIFHWFVIIFVIVTPFLKDQRLLVIDLMLMYSILIHWIANNNVCCLTIMEKILRDEPDDGKTFFGRLMGPVYTYGYDDYICHGILFVLMMIIVYKLDIRELKFSEFFRLIKR